MENLDFTKFSYTMYKLRKSIYFDFRFFIEKERGPGRVVLM